MPPPDLSAQDERTSLLVLSRIEATLDLERAQLMERINHGESDGVSDLRAFANSLPKRIADDLAAYSADRGLPIEIDERRIRSELSSFEMQFVAELSELAAASRRVRDLNLPESTLQELAQGASISFNDVGGYATAGAMAGSFLPGVGTVLGAAAGGMYGVYKNDSKNEEVLAAYASSQEDVLAVLEKVELEAYAGVAETNPLLCGPSVMRSTHRSMRSRLESADPETRSPLEMLTVLDPSNASSETEDAYGPLLHAKLSLLAYHAWGDAMKAAGDMWPTGIPRSALEDFSYDWRIMEALADTFNVVNDTETARIASRMAREAGGDSGELSVTEAISAGLNGDHARALEMLATAERHGVDPMRLGSIKIDSLAALGNMDGAARVLKQMVGVSHSIFELQSTIEAHPALLEHGSLRDWFGPDGPQAMITSWFQTASACQIEPGNGTKLANATQKYIGAVDQGRVLLLLDDTVWGSAKNGVAVTSNHILWCELWEDPDLIELTDRGHGAHAEVSEDGDLMLYRSELDPCNLPCPSAYREPLVRLINALR